MVACVRDKRGGNSTDLGLHVLGEVALGLEGELAVQALVGAVVGVGAQVLLEHAGLLAADAAHLADVLAAAPPPHVLVVLLALVAGPQLEGHPLVVEDLHHLVLRQPRHQLGVRGGRRPAEVMTPLAGRGVTVCWGKNDMQCWWCWMVSMLPYMYVVTCT